MLKSALLDECDRRMRSQGKARSTRKTYRKHLESLLKWAKWKSGNWQHPRDIGRDGVQHWLSDLANVKNVSPTTQNCALQAALYLFREVLRMPLENIDAMRARRPERLPVVLSVQDVRKILSGLSGRDLNGFKICSGELTKLIEAIQKASPVSQQESPNRYPWVGLD